MADGLTAQPMQIGDCRRQYVCYVKSTGVSYCHTDEKFRGEKRNTKIEGKGA